MKLLAFDTSTEHLSVAVANGDAVWQYSGAGGARASTDLVPKVLELVGQAGLQLSELDAICFGAGPGSFTGLRTACAVAQGLAFGANVPVLAVDSLMALAEEARFHRDQPAQDSETIALLDARMDEIYTARFAWHQGRWRALSVDVLVRPQDLVDQCSALSEPRPHLAGNAFGVYAPLQALQSQFNCASALPTATAMLRLAPALLADGQAVPADQALPRYVRDKVAKTTAERMAEKAGGAA